MIELTAREYLAGILSVPAVCEVPEGPPPSYVVLEKTGSSSRDGLSKATIAVKSVAPTLYGAMLLNEQVKAAMQGMTDMDNIFRCHCDSDYNFTDTRSKEYRYQAVYEIIYKE